MPDGLRPPYDVGDGTTCNDMLGALPLVEYRFAKAGWIEQDFSGLVMQWSGRTDVTASASTHASGAVFDVAYRLVNTDAKLRCWQQCGFTPFKRYPPKFPYHGHVLVNGCDHLHWSADKQIAAARDGRDGLVSNGPYPGPTDVDYRTWRQAQVIYADLVEEMNMPSAEEIAKEVWREDGYINNRGFAPGSAGNFVSANDALYGIMHRLDTLPSSGDVAAAVDNALAGEESAINAQLAALAALAKTQGSALGTLAAKVDTLASALAARASAEDAPE